MKKKLRQEVARLMKEKRLGKLYNGNKLTAHYYLTTGSLRRKLRVLTLKPGDVFNDCDGFNHVVKSILLKSYSDCYTKISHLESTVLFEDGRYSCGCGQEFQPPLSPEKINEYHYAYMHDAHLIKQGWVPNNKTHWMFRCWEEGKMVCDENGFSRQKEYE